MGPVPCTCLGYGIDVPLSISARWQDPLVLVLCLAVTLSFSFFRLRFRFDTRLLFFYFVCYESQAYFVSYIVLYDLANHNKHKCSQVIHCNNDLPWFRASKQV
jgi:hypothetical protein